MADVTMMRRAESIAEGALAETSADETTALCRSDAIVAFHAHCGDAKERYNGRELTLFESKPDRTDRFFTALIEGNYRETAARLAGINYRTIQLWLQYADEGQKRYRCECGVCR